jgi:hypothetical protein
VLYFVSTRKLATQKGFNSLDQVCISLTRWEDFALQEWNGICWTWVLVFIFPLKDFNGFVLVSYFVLIYIANVRLFVDKRGQQAK